MKGEVRQRARKRLDERLRALQPAENFRAPPKGWVRALRDALGMTGAQLGSRMGIRPQTVETIEKSEASGTIQLGTLRRAAEALGNIGDRSDAPAVAEICRRVDRLLEGDPHLLAVRCRDRGRQRARRA